MIVVYVVVAEGAYGSGTALGVGGIVIYVLSIIFNIAAIIFSALFTWKRPAN